MCHTIWYFGRSTSSSRLWDQLRHSDHYGCLGMIAGINMKSRVSYNVCIAMENRCRIRIFGTSCAMNAIALKTKRIGHPGRSVAAKFEVTAYSKLAPRKISNLCIFEYTYVYSNIHGHFVDDYRIWTPFDSRPVNSKLWVSANP